MNVSWAFAPAWKMLKGIIIQKLFRIVLCAAIVSCAGIEPVFSQEHESDAQQVIKQVQESIAGLKDVSVFLTQVNQNGGTSTRFKGTLQFKNPDNFKADIEISDLAGNTLKSLSVYDGRVLWQEQTNTLSGKITVFKSIMQGSTPQAREFMKQFNPKEQLQNLMNDYSVLSVNKQIDVNGHIDVIELEMKPQVRQKMQQKLKAFANNVKKKERIPERATIYWDENTQYISKLHIFSKDQELKLRTTYTNIKINSGIDDAVFAYIAPEGINIIDMSKAMAEEIVKRELEGADHELAGSACPAFSLPDMQGENISSDTLRGKVVIINFWEPLSPLCKKELPLIESLFQSVFEEEARVLTITSDADGAMRVIDENGYFFPVLIDKQAALAKQLKVLSIPRTFVLDPQGVIRAVYIGYHENIKDLLTEAIIQFKENED